MLLFLVWYLPEVMVGGLSLCALFLTVWAILWFVDVGANFLPRFKSKGKQR